MKALVIAEKPSVAQSIAAIVGAGEKFTQKITVCGVDLHRVEPGPFRACRGVGEFFCQRVNFILRHFPAFRAVGGCRVW